MYTFVPRYNDLTRPRALQINTDPRQGRLHTSDGDGTSGVYRTRIRLLVVRRQLVSQQED